AQKVYSLLPAGEQGTVDSHLFLARLFYNQKQYTFAMTEARKVQEIDKNNVHAINLKGMVFARRDQLILAIREFEESLSIQPDQPDIQQIVEVLKKSR
ncbi:MAG TPA: hypothetical protein PKH07_18465, partial [bacterium]|nr:hypothetical protein [bacterium]